MANRIISELRASGGTLIRRFYFEVMIIAYAKCTTFQAIKANPNELQQGVNATHHLLEGYVKALGSETPECSAFHLCEAGASATRLGPVGRSFAKVARYL